MVEKIARQAGALAQPMLFAAIPALLSPAARYSEFFSRMSQAMPICPTSDFRPATASEAGAIGPRGALEAVDFAQLPQRLVDFP